MEVADEAEIKSRRRGSRAVSLASDSFKERFFNYICESTTKSTARNYMHQLENEVREYINKEVDKAADSIFSYRTVEEVELCIGLLQDSDKFQEDNIKHHCFMTASLNKYLQFIRSIS